MATSVTIEPPVDPKHRWWWDRTAPLLESNLTWSKGYTEQEIAEHMRTFRDIAIPTFGKPTPEAEVTPLLTLDGSTFEPSWNFQEGSDGVVRYTFEPLGDEAGTSTDPFASRIIPTLSSVLASASSGADMRWFDQITNSWVVTSEEVHLARKNMPSHMKRVPQLFVAFDMKGSRRLLKAYFFPVLKHFASGIPTETLALDMIRSLEPCGDRLAPSAEKLIKYLSTCTNPTPVEMMAIDCADPEAARVKVYARTQLNSIAALRDGFTLGGTQTDEVTMKAVEEVSKIWHLLLDERDGLDDDQSKPPRELHTLHKGICFVFELRAGASRIDVKAHLPWCQTSASDNNAIENFSKALRVFGWDTAADKFENGAKASSRCL